MTPKELKEILKPFIKQNAKQILDDYRDLISDISELRQKTKDFANLKDNISLIQDFVKKDQKNQVIIGMFSYLEVVLSQSKYLFKNNWNDFNPEGLQDISLEEEKKIFIGLQSRANKYLQKISQDLSDCFGKEIKMLEIAKQEMLFDCATLEQQKKSVSIAAQEIDKLFDRFRNGEISKKYLISSNFISSLQYIYASSMFKYRCSLIKTFKDFVEKEFLEFPQTAKVQKMLDYVDIPEKISYVDRIQQKRSRGNQDISKS